LEEELDIQHREIRRIISENTLVVDENTHLQSKLTAAKDEVHRLGQVIPNLRAEKEQRVRELTQRGLKLEAELRGSEPLRVEVKQLKAEVKSLDTVRKDLSSQVRGLKDEISHLEAENRQKDSMRDDIDGMRNKIVEARRAIEYEKKTHEELVELNQAMEKNLISMAREIEKLRAEQLNAEWRARGLGGGSYGMYNGTSEMGYLGSAYGVGYGGAWGPYGSSSDPHRR
jgi:chromosome segregation ATPase